MAKIVFNASKHQIQVAAALAANAAQPAGMGWLHYVRDQLFTAQDMKVFWDGKDEFKADYVQGRCTKFGVWRAHSSIYGKQVNGFKWMTGYDTQPTYETWRHVYPTYEELLKVAGITDYKII